MYEPATLNYKNFNKYCTKSILNWLHLEGYKFSERALSYKLTHDLDVKQYEIIKFGGFHLKKSISGSFQNFIFIVIHQQLSKCHRESIGVEYNQ